jgi:hypothetical protein
MRKTLVRKQITVPGNLQLGCDEFNACRFFEAHEFFEEIWQQEDGDVRDLYKGLIQVAAAFVHISRGNATGADRLCRTALGYLRPYRELGAMGFDVERIASDTERAHRRVAELGRDLDAYDLSLRPYYTFDARALPAEALRWAAWGFDAHGVAMPVEIIVAE